MLTTKPPQKTHIFNRTDDFFFLRATPAAHESSQAKGQIGAATVGLYQSHSNARSKPYLQPIPQLTAILDP